MAPQFSVLDHINGLWQPVESNELFPVRNPATGEILALSTPGSAARASEAAGAAAAAFPAWRATPPAERVQFLFRLKQLLEENFDSIARITTLENGKTLAESRGELRRGVENIEVACGIPLMMQGDALEDVARGIDEFMLRQPLGAVAAITPFNFPSMIPLWFLPYAVACGNTFILKPSEKTPLSAMRIFELVEQAGFPPGVVNLVHGAKETVGGLLDHPAVQAVSFVGSSPVARSIYSRASANGKRVQCQGGAKNYVIVMPDADPDLTTRIITDSAFGCAGQRCLAVSTAVTVGGARQWFRDSIAAAASGLKVGSGLDDDVQMGPVVTPESKARIERLIRDGLAEGATAAAGGGALEVPGCERGTFVSPTVLDSVPPAGALAATEIFGPVLSLVHADSLDEAIALINRGAYGNAASIFTSSGAHARRFRNSVEAGNAGINVGVAAPMAYFPFSGWKGSFFGVQHAQGRDAVQFYTAEKVVIERWPREWSRKF